MVYEFKEYPKWIKDKDGRDIGIANSAKEEAKFNKKEEKETKKKSTEKDGW